MSCSINGDSSASARCPSCGQPNVCAVARDPKARTCWCQVVATSPAVLLRIKERFPAAACLCRACLEREATAATAAESGRL
jgi:Cysteine-rich CWC